MQAIAAELQIGNALYAIHTDHLNTPRRLTAVNGNHVWQWVTTGFGELEPTTASTGFTRARLNTGTPAIANTAQVEFNLRYPGQQHDPETGLFYNHHRTYDPYLTVGYTQADPLGQEAGWNRFAYVESDSLNSIDPEGLRGNDIAGYRPNNALNAAGYHDLRGYFVCEQWNCPKKPFVCTPLDDKKPTDFLPAANSADVNEAPEGCTCVALGYRHDWSPTPPEWKDIVDAMNNARDANRMRWRWRQSIQRLPHWHHLGGMGK